MKLKIYYFIEICLVILQFRSILSSTNEELLTNPYYYQDEICSYNGKVDTAISNTKYIKCECNKDYTDDPDQTLKINDITIQCSYQKKRKFIALFFAIFIPCGLDHLYIGNYILFGILFCFYVIVILGNMYRFAISSEDDYLKNKINLVFFIFVFIFIAVWIADILFIFLYSKDHNGNPLVEDVALLFDL